MNFYNQIKQVNLFLILFTVGIISPFNAIFAASGKIAGQVVDKETTEPLPGVNILIETLWQFDKEVRIETAMGAASDVDGYYVILNVPAGTYNVKAVMVGYKEMIKQKVRVNIDRTITVDFEMESAVLEMETIEVTADKEVIKKDVSGTQEIILSNIIAETPVLRMDEFINKIKGVELIASNDGQGLSVRGGAIRETDVRMDGMSLRDPRSENSYLSLNSTSVEELQVLTGGFEAKYGGIQSGLVNVVTKEGNRDKYGLSFKIDYTGANQKFYGENPWSDDSWIYRVFADTTENGYAWDGTRNDTTGLVPEELRYFRGWNNRGEGKRNYEAIGLPKNASLTPEQKRELWLLQHPQYEFAQKPDIFIEGTVTGPVPGSGIPLLGNYIQNSTFMLAGKYENTQLAFPLGPRDDYVDWNTQLKISHQMAPDKKLTLNGMYAKIESITAGRPSTFGGALVDNSSRFNFLSSNSVSVDQQARLLGGSSGFTQMFNKSRLQFFDKRFFVGGAKFSHALNPKAFYTLDLQLSYSDHKIRPFELDSTRGSAWAYVDSFRVLNVPSGGSPNASTNWLTDITDFFWLYGGLQAQDSSYSWAANLKGDFTGQWGKHHQIEAGFNFNYNYIYVNSGTWLQSERSFTPDTWQYFTAKPIDIGLYIQDKLEFKGMIANVGLRADYFSPNKKGFEVRQPLDQDYADFYNLVYQNLPGKFGSWEKWEAFRERLDSPDGWPETETKTQFKLSPRLGVSFPVTVSSKLYFNYGHFYQRPNIHFLYNLAVSPGSAIVPSTDLEMAKTVAYEVGYEQSFLSNFLVNLSFYYKDVKNEPLNRTYVDYFEELYVNKYSPDSYRDIRGIELRLNKNFGRFVTFWTNYEYMLQSRGSSGLAYIYENRLRAEEEKRNANIIVTDPLPRAHGNLNIHSPSEWGPALFGFKPLSSIFINLLYEWKDGGRQIINPNEPESQWKQIQVVDYSNADLRASKLFRLAGFNMEFVLTIQNLFDQRRLAYWNMSTAQFDRYKESLHLSFETGEQHGNDKLGEWDKDHIDIGWFTAPLFLNPRRVLFGFRINF